MPKVAVVIGHNARAKGAYSGHLGEYEYEFNRSVFAEMQALRTASRLHLREFLREDVGSYSREIDAVYGEVDAWGADLIVELHFNAGGGVGSEMLYAQGSVGGKSLASYLQGAFVELGFRNRGAKPKAETNRGGRSLYASRKITVLAEPFFGDSEADCEIVQSIGPKGIARAYLAGINSFLGRASVDPAPKPDPEPEENIFKDIMPDSEKSPRTDPVQVARWRIKAALDDLNDVAATLAAALDELPHSSD